MRRDQPAPAVQRNAHMSAARMSHIGAGITGRLRGECTMTNAPAIARMGDARWLGVRHPVILSRGRA